MRIQTLVKMSVVVLGLMAASSTLRADDGPDFRSYLNIYTRPTVSPYLALVPQILNAGNGNYVSVPTTPGLYQNLIRPAQDAQNNSFRQSIQAQNQAYSPVGPGFQTRTAQTTGVSTSVRPTGHSASSFNYSHYYNFNSHKPR